MNSDVVYFYANNNNIAWQTNSAGIMTQENKPAMAGTAIRDVSGAPVDGYIANNQNVYVSTLRCNNGSHWNNSTGVWTCPVEGMYFVYASWLIDNNHPNSTVARYAWLHNGVETYKCYNGDKTGGTSFYGNQASGGGILSCSANDTITIRATNGNWHSGGESGFSIHLLN